MHSGDRQRYWRDLLGTGICNPQGVVKREAVLRVLELGWQLFRTRYQEELLVHLVGGLAWTLCIDEREADAVALLRTIWDGKHPFNPSYITERKGKENVPKPDRLRLPTLIPIGERLAGLVDGQDKALVLSAIKRLGSKRFTEHTVEIRGKKIVLHPKVGYTLAIPGKKITLRPGMQYNGASPRDSVALVKAYNTTGLPYSNAEPPIFNFRRSALYTFSPMSDEERAATIGQMG